MAYVLVSACSFTCAMSLGFGLMLCVGDARAEAPPAAAKARPTFRLEYRRLDEQSARTCPNEQSVRRIAEHVFGYAVIDDDAKFAISIDVTTSRQPSRYEAVSHILDGDQISRMTRIHAFEGTRPDDCLKAIYEALAVLADFGDRRLKELQALPPPNLPPETKEPPAEEKEKAEEPVKTPPPAPPPPPPQVTVQLPTPTLKRPEGFALEAGLTASVGLMPTPSLGGLVGVYFRRGDWSGGLEGRVEHGPMPAYLQSLPVDSLYAGAAIVAPCVHQGMFSGCFVTEGGGYSFSMLTPFALLEGRWALLGVGLRTNLEHRVGEHFLLRGFLQISAIPVGPSIDFQKDSKNLHLWNTGPAFGTVGLTLVSIP